MDLKFSNLMRSGKQNIRFSVAILAAALLFIPLSSYLANLPANLNFMHFFLAVAPNVTPNSTTIVNTTVPTTLTTMPTTAPTTQPQTTTTCPSGTTLNATTESCQPISCPAGQQFNVTSAACKNIPAPTSNTTTNTLQISSNPSSNLITNNTGHNNTVNNTTTNQITQNSITTNPPPGNSITNNTRNQTITNQTPSNTITPPNNSINSTGNGASSNTITSNAISSNTLPSDMATSVSTTPQTTTIPPTTQPTTLTTTVPPTTVPQQTNNINQNVSGPNTQLTGQLTIQNPYAIINRSKVTTTTVRRGQPVSITLFDNGSTGGLPPYKYQWLESYNGQPLANATDCGPGNSPSLDIVTPCFITVTPDMSLGKYLFKIEVTDATGNTVVDDGFTLNVVTYLTVNTTVLYGSGSAEFVGKASGAANTTGTATYKILWLVNGTMTNDTHTCTYSVPTSASNPDSNTNITSSLTLTYGATYTCNYPSGASGSFNLTDGTYNITFFAADATNPSNNDSTTTQLIADWPSGIFGTNTISLDQSVPITVAWQPTGYCNGNVNYGGYAYVVYYPRSTCSAYEWKNYTYSISLYTYNTNTNKCNYPGTPVNTLTTYQPSTLYDGSHPLFHQTTFFVTPGTSGT
ncbi:MAG: hypothetical protein KGH67_04685, partial [Candidatus Micrarchaeota archaeon]|nr:hypothetical protein [Candidatus Micrarchaeota archaeon]